MSRRYDRILWSEVPPEKNPLDLNWLPWENKEACKINEFRPSGRLLAVFEDCNISLREQEIVILQCIKEKLMNRIKKQK